MRVVKVATCSLNQWAMEFDWNMKNIKESISRAKEAGAAIRLGPELEITGYGCEDHFLEQDTITHSWECLKELVVGDWTDGILCSFGMPVMRGSERYNCQVLCLNRKILLIRPKMWLANGDSCGELRWFTAWKHKHPCQLDNFLLPSHVSDALSQTTAPFGYGYLQFLDTAVGCEICMELFSPVQIHPQLALNGVEILLNASGSVHLLGKMEGRLGAIKSAMSARGGVYMYSNHLGCDGGRAYYDGCSCIVVNGDVISQGLQFSLKDVDMVVAQVDLDTVNRARACNSSFREQASSKTKVSSIFVPYKLCSSFNLRKCVSSPIEIHAYCREEEIGLGGACWLWNYLRRSGASGFVLKLSRGVGSTAVAAIVGCMCQLVVKEIENGNNQVKADAIRIGNYIDEQFPTDNKEFAKRIFYTLFMGSQDSCDGSRAHSKVVAEEIGSWHLDVPIDVVISSLLSLFHTLTGKRHTSNESALQNIGSRSRMVATFMLASLLPWAHDKPGFYLVLSSTTGDEGLLCANLTKYGCSSGDINPIGSINQLDLRAFLNWASNNLGYPSLAQLNIKLETVVSVNACELYGAPDPNKQLKFQELEREMTNRQPSSTPDNVGMTEEEISIYGRLRRTIRCGPVSMFESLCDKWGPKLSPSEIGDKVKHFFKCYAMSRHKTTVLTPSYLVERNSADDNRFDLRQFLYNSSWPYQFRKIDKLLHQHQLNGFGEALAKSND